MITWDNLPSEVMNVTCVYDAPEAGCRVRTIVRRLDLLLGRGIEFDLRLWRADLLDEPAIYTRALRDASVSNLLTVAFADNGRIHGGLERLVEEWSGKHHSPAALAVLPTDHDIHSLVVETFRRLAVQNDVDFICSEEPELSVPRFTAPMPQPRRWVLPDDKYGEEMHSFRFFGLNE